MMCCKLLYMFGFFSKQKTAYEMRISDCSSDVCSSDLKEIEPRRAKTYLITKGRSCPLCGAPHSGDHDAEYHGNLTEQHVRPLHVPASDFPCAHCVQRAAGVRIGAGSVPVKDRYREKGRTKSKNSRRGVGRKKEIGREAGRERGGQ